MKSLIDSIKQTTDRFDLLEYQRHIIVACCLGHISQEEFDEVNPVIVQRINELDNKYKKAVNSQLTLGYK